MNIDISKHFEHKITFVDAAKSLTTRSGSLGKVKSYALEY